MNLINHIKKLFPYAYAITKNRMDAEDLLQDVAVKVFSNEEYFNSKPESEIPILLMRTLKNRHVDLWRRSKPTTELVYDNRAVQNDAWGRLQKQELQKALVHLKEKENLCFRLKLDGYNTNQIQQIMNVSKSNALQLVFKAKNKVKKHLAAVVILLLCLNTAQAQTYTGLTTVTVQTHTHIPVIDTVEQLIPVMDSSRIWSYYHGDGKAAWLNVKTGYDAALIPTGGYAIKGKLLKPQFYAIDGFVVTITDCCNRMVTVKILDVNKQPLKKPLMVVWPYNIPVNGFDYK